MATIEIRMLGDFEIRVNGKPVLAVLGGMILVVLGIMGEYVGRIYMCANAAPQYVEREVIRHEGDNA